jgi:cytochrome c peroxidase
LLTSRFNLMGIYNDDGTRANAAATGRARDDGRRAGEFRTPGLRNVAVTGPYMHNGRLETLAAVVTQHANATRQTTSRALSNGEVADLVAFLATLTDADGERRPGRAGKFPCP